MWLFNPHRRYILNYSQLEVLKSHLATISDLKGSGALRQLDATTRLSGAHLLIERYRDRGIGDMLFVGAVLQYLYDLSGSTATIDFYSILDRASVLRHHPALKYGPLAGPIHYDDLQHYTAHWFIDSLTEHVEEPDQPNVYDNLYRQIGINPANVAARYKRPVVYFSNQDWRDLDSVYAACFAKQQVDLRVTPYIVLCPLAYSSLRVAPYSLWLNLAQKLAEKYVVIFVGRTTDQGQLPVPDMTFGEMYQHVEQMVKHNKHRVFNLMGPTPLRPMMALVARATAVISLDSGLLYVAQAARVPAVSLWGTHAPHVRLLYDPPYMRGAIWRRDGCAHSPCFAFAGFPTDKCPAGEEQKVCNVLASVTVEDILKKLEIVLTDVEGALPPPPMTIEPTILLPEPQIKA
jgi:ADP-heptose:LPS heptosyltransferase